MVATRALGGGRVPPASAGDHPAGPVPPGGTEPQPVRGAGATASTRFAEVTAPADQREQGTKLGRLQTGGFRHGQATRGRPNRAGKESWAPAATAAVARRSRAGSARDVDG